jgi:hypothetical protein
MRQTGRREWLLLATDPDVVWDKAQSLVTAIGSKDSAVLVLEIVPATGLESNTVKVKPGSPEASREEAGVAVGQTTSVVAEREINLVLNIEVDDTHDTIGGQQGPNRVDNRIVVRLSMVSFQWSSQLGQGLGKVM